MIGSIIGDLAGSIYEYDQTINCKSIKLNKLISKDAFYSDDTILTIAILDAILTNTSYEQKMKEYAKKYNNLLPNHKPYFETMFSPNFYKWAISNVQGKSCGNGAMMRISPVGFMFNNESEVIENAKLVTIPSHNSVEAINCATIIALIIFYSRQKMSKDDIVKKLNLEILQTKPHITKFNLTCNETLPLVLYAWYNSNSFEDAIKLVVSFGGDTDTNACIVGGIAEAIYGVDEKLKQIAYNKLPNEFKLIIDKIYQVK